MLLLIAVPVIILAAVAHDLLRAYAPSNALICRLRGSRPTLPRAGALAVLALLCLSVMHALALAIEAGAPGWLNLLVLVLAWDVIKFGWFAVTLLLGAPRVACPRWAGRAARSPQPGFYSRPVPAHLSRHAH